MEEIGLVCGSMALTVCCDTVHGVPRHLSGPSIFWPLVGNHSSLITAMVAIVSRHGPVTTEPASLKLKTLRQNLFSFKLITSDILLEQ